MSAFQDVSPPQSTTGAPAVSDGEVIVVVMGATGAGKSNFINVATGNNDSTVGHNLHSCTKDIQLTRCCHPDGSGRKFVLVDTPGFEDTDMTDVEVLIRISHWLTATYKRNVLLNGLLFLHRISDNRIGATPARNLTIFERVCGSSALPHVKLITTKWDEVDELIASGREENLRIDHWKSMIDGGARMLRFHNTHQSAWDILNQFTCAGILLQLQSEIVDEGKQFTQTAAGTTISQWIEKFISQLRQMIKKITKPLRGGSKGAKSEKKATLIREKMDECPEVNEQKNELPNELAPRPRQSFQSVVREVMNSRAPHPSTSPKSNMAPLLSSPSDGLPMVPPIPRRRGRLGGIIIALTHVKDTAELAPVPCLKGAVSLALTIAQSVEAMKKTEHSLITLAQTASRFIFTIDANLKHGGISDEMRGAIEDLSWELERAYTAIREITARGCIDRFFLQPADEQFFLDCNEKIHVALELFELQCAISNAQALTRIEAKMSFLTHELCYHD